MIRYEPRDDRERARLLRASREHHPAKVKIGLGTNLYRVLPSFGGPHVWLYPDSAPRWQQHPKRPPK